MIVTPASGMHDPAYRHDQKLRSRAQELESVFLAEMLRHAGLGKAPGGFDGGIGEEQFASFLREAQARAIVAKGGLGLAEQIYNSLKERTDDTR